MVLMSIGNGGLGLPTSGAAVVDVDVAASSPLHATPNNGASARRAMIVPRLIF
jgi:hypothetical protein